MDKEKRRFWITCLRCKQKFGVDAKLIFKYIDRLLGQFEERFKEIEKDLKKGESK